MKRIRGHRLRYMLGVTVALALWSVTALAADPLKLAATYGDGANPFHLATGSPGELGLLEALAQAFAQQNPATLLWVKAGSGKSLDLLKNRQVDMVMVHAPTAEKKAVTEGWAVEPTLIGSNEFYIVGPKADPAGIQGAQSAADAYRRIAEAKANFITRADNSGTHKKELQIWKQAGIEPGGDWYIPTKDFMTASLKKANEVDGYFMTDSSTWVAEKTNLPNLAVQFRGDPFLVNTYHALVAPSGATAARDIASAFVNFVASEQGQRIISEYGKDRYGEALYQNAEYAQQFVD
ncbi:MAG: solute-binding protein [Candidatus Competibacteraceae bacterium]|nr:solute-binding protein [Candidatus Competibacteraceae bacterium]